MVGTAIKDTKNIRPSLELPHTSLTGAEHYGEA